MAQDFSRAFYNSAAWKACRESYKRSKGGLCEDCLKQGRITAGAEVHHIKALTPDNIGNPNITLNWDNLCLLCKDCHEEEKDRVQKRLPRETAHGSAVSYRQSHGRGNFFVKNRVITRKSAPDGSP